MIGWFEAVLLGAVVLAGLCAWRAFGPRRPVDFDGMLAPKPEMPERRTRTRVRELYPKR